MEEGIGGQSLYYVGCILFFHNVKQKNSFKFNYKYKYKYKIQIQIQIQIQKQKQKQQTKLKFSTTYKYFVFCSMLFNIHYLSFKSMMIVVRNNNNNEQKLNFSTTYGKIYVEIFINYLITEGVFK